MANMDDSALVERRLQSKKVFSGNLLQVYSDSVVLPDESRAIREWIDHPGAAAIIPVFDDGSTLLVEQFRYSVQEIMLEVPAGKRDGDEPFLETARRELDEETGWYAEEMIHLGKSFPVLGYSNEIIHFYLAKRLKPGSAEKEADEFLRIKRLPLDAALKLVRSGEIQDMKSIVGIMRAYEYMSGK